MMPVYVSYS